ncbi:MAG TPA: SusD/RagB family nutrient-binding outer membrane lipoprotein, partial [Ohtaekwangia sp.]|nr:SusD/RagB family nutrient-binding outer membrane lipoprotein [Ohtaekwangia sp.]
MKRNINTFVKSCLLVPAFFMAGCGDFLDINTDPNNPLDSDLKLVLPVAQATIAEALGNGSGGMSDLTSQLVHQTVQRNTSNFYFIGGTEFNISNSWPNLFSGALMDLNVMIEKATAQESWHYLGIAQTLKAYSYSMAVDLWGDVPYFEFGKGTDNPFPSFDQGQAVYEEVFKLLDEATTNLAKDSQVGPTNDDLIYGGDIDQWIQLANSLKLKLYNQVRLTGLYDAAAVDAIINDMEL